MKRDRIILAPPERRELQRRARSRTLRQEDARRARVVLLLASGATWTTIQERVGCAPAFINKWNKRFREGRVPALASRKSKGRPPTVLTPAMEARILAETREEPPDGSTHWSTRRLGKHLGVSHSVVHQVWKRAGFKPHRLERYYGVERPGLREEGGGRDRPVSESAGERRGVQRGREDGDPGAGSHRPRSSDVARACGAATASSTTATARAR